MENSGPECCWLFIDNSNLFIEGQKYYARKNKLIRGIEQDIRMRFDMGKLVSHLAPKANRKTYLYGSEPPPVDTIWEAIRRQDIEVEKFPKSFQGKEKEVDTSLSVDAVAEAAENRGKNGRFVIIGGDRDYKRCVEKILEYGFQVNLYSWKNCISSHFERLAKERKQLSIEYLDGVFERFPDIYFYNAQWKTHNIHGSLNPIPAERTIIIQFHKSPSTQVKKQIVSKKEVEKVTQHLGIPFYYNWTWGSSAEKESATIRKVKDIAPEENDGKRQLLIIFGPPESTGKIEDDMDELTIQNLIDNGWTDIEEYLKSMRKSTRLYDFTEILTKNKAWLQQYFENFGSVEVVVSYVIFYNQAPLDIRRASNEREAEDLEDADENEGSFTVAGVRKKKKMHQLSSNSCGQGRRCLWGLKCKYKHSDEEREYFKKNPNGMMRMTRKTKPCPHFVKKQCNYNKTDCNYAHGECDAYCYYCGAEGKHFAHSCPQKPS